MHISGLKVEVHKLCYPARAAIGVGIHIYYMYIGMFVDKTLYRCFLQKRFPRRASSSKSMIFLCNAYLALFVRM